MPRSTYANNVILNVYMDERSVDSETSDFEVINASDCEEINQPSNELSETIKKIRKWLQPTRYDAPHSSEFQRHLTSLTPGTGQWIRQSEQYRTWVQSHKHGTLWIRGIPGAGKSVLAASIISELASKNVPVLYFFFRQIIMTNRTAISLIRDWLTQLLPYSPMLADSLKPLANENHDIASISFNMWWHYLCTAVQYLPHVYCITDALDEMEDDIGFLRQLIDLGNLKPRSVKVLMTSRPVPHIENTFKNSGILSLRLDQWHVDADIDIYVNRRLTDPIHYDLPQELKAYIIHTISARGRGLFLYARLMMDAIITALQQGKTPNIAVAKRAVEELPMDLDGMYTCMLSEHANRLKIEQSLQFSILQWVTHSRRPLRLLEMTSIIHFLAEDEMSFKDRKLQVKNACGPLVEVVEDETLQIIHHSFTEFLVGHRNKLRIASVPAFPFITSNEAHMAIASACIRYLMSSNEPRQAHIAENLKKLDVTDYAQDSVRLNFHHAFNEYATTYWHEHSTACHDLGEELTKILDDFFAPNGTLFRRILPRNEKDRPFKYGVERNKAYFTSSLHIAAKFGITGYVAHLLKNQYDPNGMDSDGNTALHAAAKHGHIDVVSLLLLLGASADPQNDDGLKPMHEAAINNHAVVVKALLRAGVSPLTPKTKASPTPCGNARSDLGDPPLRFAALTGHYESTVEMLPHLSSQGLEDALCWAIRSGNDNLALKILESTTVSPNAAQHKTNALYLAAASHSPTIVKALLDRGADPNIRSLDQHEGRMWAVSASKLLGLTPLHGFAKHNIHRPIRGGGSNHLDETNSCTAFQLLLEAGLDINAVDDEGNTPLLSLIKCCSHPVTYLVNLFLKNGADPSKTNFRGVSPVYALSSLSFANDALEAVIQHGGDINGPLESPNKSPIFKAMYASEPTALDTLLKHGVDCAVQHSDTGNTPMHNLFMTGIISGDTEKRLDMLIAAGVKLTASNHDGNTVLHLVQKDHENSENLVRKLLKAGLGLEIQNHLGDTVLLHGVRKGGLHTLRGHTGVKLLTKLGANINACDHNGRSAVHLICRKQGAVSVLKHFVEQGADIHRRDYNGNTILHAVVDAYEQNWGNALGMESDMDEKGPLEMVLALGINKAMKNHHGQSAIHIAAAKVFQVGTGRVKQHGIQYLDLLIQISSIEELNSRDNLGRVPLHYAATASEYNVLKLLKAGADPALLDTSRRSPLHYAASARMANIAALLSNTYKSRYPSMLEHCDASGRTALHYTIRSGKYESVDVLLMAGACPNRKDHQSKSSLLICTEIEEEEVIYDFYRNNSDILCLEHRDILRPALPATRTNFKNDGKGLHALFIQNIVKLLIKHGAYLTTGQDSNLGIRHANHSRDAFKVGLLQGHAALVQELRASVERGYLPAHHGLLQEPTRAENKLLFGHEETKNDIKAYFEDSGNLERRDAYFAVGRHKNHLYEENLVKLLLELGAKFTTLWFNSGENALTFIVDNGLVNSIIHLSSEVQLHEDDAYWEQMFEKKAYVPNYPQPLLIRACMRETINLSMIRVLVKDLHVTMNRHGKCRRDHHSEWINGPTALHFLAKGEHWWHLEALEYLLLHGANVNATNEDGETPLHIACRGSHIQTDPKGFSGVWHCQAVTILLRYGADVNALNINGQSCMSEAADHIDVVRELLFSGTDINLGRMPPLFAAIWCGNVEVTRCLLDANADPNMIVTKNTNDLNASKRRIKTMFPAQDPDWPDETIQVDYPLMRAALLPMNKDKKTTEESRRRAQSLIELLLDRGADYKLHVQKGHSILNHVFGNLSAVFEPFLTYSGIDLNLQDSQGRTPILGAISAYNKQLFRRRKFEEDNESNSVPLQLLRKGVDVTLTDIYGSNILHYLLSNENDYCISATKFGKFLDDAKIKTLVSRKDHAGFKPIHVALQRQISSEQHIRMLMDLGADILELDPKGNNPLHHLARFVDDGDTTTLWDECQALGADINAQNTDGDVPLFIWLRNTVKAQHPAACRKTFLKFDRANIHARNKRGESCLHIIAQRSPYCRPAFNHGENHSGFRDLFKMFMEMGLDPMAEDAWQQTALDVAARSKHEDILEMFARHTG